MDLGLSGKSYVVTAASRGLGFSVARELLREGACVMLSSSDVTKLEDAGRRLRSEDLTNFELQVCDLKSDPDIAKLWESASTKLGDVYGLVTNCGGPPAGAPLGITDSQWQDAYEGVLLSVIRLCRRFVPPMTERQDGVVLAITSSTVKQPIYNLTTSNALRPAVAGYLKSLANEVAPKQVRVNVIAPGRFLTERTQELEEALSSRTGQSVEEVRAFYETEIPMGRIADIHEFPALCAMLLSPRTSYVTGQVICPDGGRVATIW